MRLAKSQAHQPFPDFFGPGFFLLNHRCKSLFQSICPDSSRAFSLFRQMHSASALFEWRFSRLAMEAAPQLKASGLDGDYRILADFGGTVLAGTPSKYGVQFVTWDWDYDRTGVSHGHYFMENYRRSLRLRQDHAVQSHGAVLGRAVRRRTSANFPLRAPS